MYLRCSVQLMSLCSSHISKCSSIIQLDESCFKPVGLFTFIA